MVAPMAKPARPSYCRVATEQGWKVVWLHAEHTHADASEASSQPRERLHSQQLSGKGSGAPPHLHGQSALGLMPGRWLCTVLQSLNVVQSTGSGAPINPTPLHMLAAVVVDAGSSMDPSLLATWPLSAATASPLLTAFHSSRGLPFEGTGATSAHQASLPVSA